MSDKMKAEEIKRVFGDMERFKYMHVVRISSAESKIYVLHSQDCVDHHPDLRECAYSKSMDVEFPEQAWTGLHDYLVIGRLGPNGELLPASLFEYDAPEIVKKEKPVKKKLVLEFVFEEEQDEIDPEYVSLRPKSVKLHRNTTLTDMELDALGEEIAQTDRWQVENWNVIQRVMGGLSEKEKLR